MNYKPKTYYIETYGCQANIADSNLICGILEALGLEQLTIPKQKNELLEHKYALENADVIIINTCSVRQKSEDKVYGLGRVAKESKVKAFIILAGCMVGSVRGERKRYDFKELEKKTGFVDAYISPDQLFEIPAILSRVGILDEWALKKYNSENIEPKQTDTTHAFVNISFGCDNFCTYCVVPYSRGREVSRSKEEILSEVEGLVNKGIKHITLCGQNVNSWGLDKKTKFELRTGSSQKIPFVQLLREVHEIPNLEKISFLSSNPFDFTQDLIDTLALPKIDNYFHIAVQSGNNDVLAAMNRRHTVEDYIDLINRIKAVRSDATFGTDLIVGFPGETRDQFMDTVELVKKIKFVVAYIAMYSVRKGTAAQINLKDDISLKEKKYRHDYLTRVWKETKA